MTERAERPSTPPDTITVIDLAADQTIEPPTVGALWPAKNVKDDRISVGIGDALIISGSPKQISEWFAAGMRLAMEAERELLADRVQEGRVMAGLAPHTTDAGRGAHQFTEGWGVGL